MYALQASGLLEGQTPIDTIEAMASAYVSAIQVGQPAGPYHLCGWSAGGLIAYEMAATASRSRPYCGAGGAC